RAAALAGRALLEALDRHRALDAEVDLLERHLERDLQVAAGLRARAPAAAEHVAEDPAAEDVAEVAEDVVDVRERRPGVLPVRAERLGTEAVVARALLGV